MKHHWTILTLLAALVLASQAVPISSEPNTVYTCYDHPDPLSPKVRVKVACPSEDQSHAKRDQQLSYNGTDYFNVDLTCTADAATCQQVQNAFTTAGRIISGVIVFNTPISVNATYASFCKLQNECSTTGLIRLGGSYPARLLTLTDTDGLQRLYPQALVKQLGLSRAPHFSTYDINSMFNSDAPFWFRGGAGIGIDQADFLFVILHEFIHGLGFTSSWNDYFNDPAVALTPSMNTYTSTSALSQSTIFGGFQEYIFDRYMYLTSDSTAVSQKTIALNQFGGSNSGNGLGTDGPSFASYTAMETAFKTSSQYSIAQGMLTMATTQRTLALVPANSTSALTLETSITPFVSGSSISHVDYQLYTNTADFLMRYLADRGVTLEDAISTGGGGPIGPGLIKFLQSIGYTIQPGVDGLGSTDGILDGGSTTPTALTTTTPAGSGGDQSGGGIGAGGICFFFCSPAPRNFRWDYWSPAMAIGTVAVVVLL